MRFHAVEFITSAASPGDFPREEYPEVAMLGRSNVGKSSLINRLVGTKGLARVSSTPGKTRLINFFKISPLPKSVPPFVLVDLPGYGYAKASKEERSKWTGLIEAYLAHRNALAGVVAIMDLRHGASPLDEQLSAWLAPLDLPVIRVVSKADLLKRSGRSEANRTVRENLHFGGQEEAIFFSARTGEGQDLLIKRIIDMAAEPGGSGSSGNG
jgi:GTP-binding protein